jgi:hypothetical protein
MIVQAESINRFVKGVTHWVVVCSSSNNMARWQRLLEPHYQGENKLKLIRSPEILITKNAGYMNQQLLKIWIAGSIQDDYVILDSKNFFIKETDLSIYDDYIASNGYGYDTSDEAFPGTIYRESAIECSRFLGNEKTRFVIPGVGTPYKISWKNMKKLIDKFHSIDIVVLWIKSVIERGKKYNPGNASVFSEFVFYAQLMTDEEIDELERTINHRPDTNRTVWNQESFINYFKEYHIPIKQKRPVTVLLDHISEKRVYTVAFHRRWFHTNPEYLAEVNNWLSKKGIYTKLKAGRSYNIQWV